MGRYREAGAEVIKVLVESRVGCVERASIDEAYVDLTDEVNRRLSSSDCIVTSELLKNTVVAGYQVDETDGRIGEALVVWKIPCINMVYKCIYFSCQCISIITNIIIIITWLVTHVKSFTEQIILSALQIHNLREKLKTIFITNLSLLLPSKILHTDLCYNSRISFSYN